MENLINEIGNHLAGNSLAALPIAFAAGVLVSFTPCVYPIIPIQLSFIGGRTISDNSSETGPRFNIRGLKLSLMFVVGMSLVYAVLGSFAALTGTLFGSWAASPWAYIVIGNIILILALSMFDVYHLQAPQYLMRLSSGKKGNGLFSALLVGAASGFVVGPCTAPALGAILVFVGTGGSVVFGAVTLFIFSIGMGTILILLGTFAGALSFLPRSGNWLNHVKTAFGIIMILIAQYNLIYAGMLFI